MTALISSLTFFTLENLLNLTNLMFSEPLPLRSLFFCKRVGIESQRVFQLNLTEKLYELLLGVIWRI